MKLRINKEGFNNVILDAFSNSINNVFESGNAYLEILSLSRKMDIDLIKLFYSKIVLGNSLKSREEFSHNLLGIYGNFIATNYFESKGYKVENEYPILKGKKVITKADLYFIDENLVKNYCEVKATSQIIDNIRNYVDVDQNKQGTYVDKDEEILKYKQIGKKLIKQVDKLKCENNKVGVIIFKGCYIDNIIFKQLKERNINLYILNFDIKDLEKMVNDTIDYMIYYINKNKKENITKS